MDDLKLVRPPRTYKLSLQHRFYRLKFLIYLPSSNRDCNEDIIAVSKGAAIGRDGVNTFIYCGRAQTRCLENSEMRSYR